MIAAAEAAVTETIRSEGTTVSGFNRAERRRALEFRTSDPLAVKFGRVMSDPATRERCLVLKFEESTTADIGGGLQVTRFEGVQTGE
jgi:hypothetical protein